MTASHLILLASVAGAALFFAAGAATGALRQQRTDAPAILDPAFAAPVVPPPVPPAPAIASTDLARMKQALENAEATMLEFRQVAEERARELELAHTDAALARTELKQMQGRLRDAERQLEEKISSSRDLGTQNEQLKGRLRDADALRSEYVRLRTVTTEAEYLKGEVKRLEKELHAARAESLAARATPPPRPRPLRATERQVTASERTIGETLAKVIERFGDAETRSTALSDTQGFPLATSGADGVALAAYAAHLFESAARAKEYLPIGAPTAIEIIDTQGIRVSVWSLEVESERLMLANLAVAPVEASRVENVLGDLTRILAPSSRARLQHTS